ncbi:MAG TPA: FG-GAP-like repeat-containing protein [Gammaproteobacteria bacterium]
MTRRGSRARARAAVAALLCGAHIACTAPAAAEAVPLFDGTLSGWSIENTGAGNIAVRDGVLRVEAPAGWLRSAAVYGDFRLRVEFRFLTDDADSGIFVRAVADGVFGRGWPANSYQVQLRNPLGESPFPPVGGIFRHGKPPGETRFDAERAARTSLGTGEWQTLEIEVMGSELEVRLNGTMLTHAAGIENPSGYVGIQAEAGALEFRAIEIEELGDLAARPTTARAADGSFISWRERIVDDETIGGVPLRGSDGLVMADLDRDGHLDIVSVHESDDRYDGAPEGHIRIAFGTADPTVWRSITVAEGPEAGAAEDVAVGDVNGDGWLDIVAACELAHLIYLQNPGRGARDAPWPRLIPAATRGRGSFIRVFLADLNGDERLEVVTANKGAQDPRRARQEPKPISFFALTGDPLDDVSWREHVLTKVPWPINSQPVDLDGDGDLDVVAGSVAERRMLWFENRSRGESFDFVEHPVAIEPAVPSADEVFVHAFNMEFVDLSGDGRLDIVTFDTPPLVGRRLLWLEQPARLGEAWRYHVIGSYAPDSLVGLSVADIDGDGDPDVMTGGYSLSPRDSDEPTPDASLGRLAWYENRGADGWARHDFSRRQRGMFDKFVAVDLDGDGDVDFAGTRGNSGAYDGVFWLEQVRTAEPRAAFQRARTHDSPEVPLP